MTGAAELSLLVDSDDFAADWDVQLEVPSKRPPRTKALTIGWVMSPPALGSGGHTTAFRMVEALESRGHKCVLFLYDRHGVDVEHRASVIAEGWPAITSDVRDASSGITGVDAVIATSWESAHVVVRRTRQPMRFLYFIQDFEPYFHAQGAEYALAEMTYRFPFRRLALGEMLDEMVRRATGLTSDVVPFGCDAAAYRPPSPARPRSGIVFYCKPDVPRRGYLLARLALERFHELCPGEEIHVYGEEPVGLRAPVTFHGRLSPAELNTLYGRTVAGLAMSFTNITLVAEEMLAAGNIPVVNEMELAHRVIESPYVKWAEPTPEAIAQALAGLVNATDGSDRSVRASASVRDRSWLPSQEAFVSLVEDEVYGRSPAGAS